MQYNPLISVVIPTYNRSDIVTSRSIPSVLNQSYQNFEIIVVLDGCTDDTEDKIKKINDPRIKVYPKSRYRYPDGCLWYIGGGPPAAFGVEQAKGTLIGVLDDDDEYMKNHLELTVKAHEDPKCDVSYGRSLWEFRGQWVIFGEPFDAERLKRGNIMIHATVVYKSKHKQFRWSPYHSIWIPSDWQRWLMMAGAGLNFTFINEVIAKHYKEGSTLSQTKTNPNVRIEALRAFELGELIKKYSECYGNVWTSEGPHL